MSSRPAPGRGPPAAARRASVLPDAAAAAPPPAAPRPAPGRASPARSARPSIEAGRGAHLVSREEVEAIVREARPPATLSAPRSADAPGQPYCAFFLATGCGAGGGGRRVSAQQDHALDRQHRGARALTLLAPQPPTQHSARAAAVRLRSAAAHARAPLLPPQEGVLKRLAGLNKPLKYIGAPPRPQRAARRNASPGALRCTLAPRPDATPARAVTTHLSQRVGAGVHSSAAAFWDPNSDGAPPCTALSPAPLPGAHRTLAACRQGVRRVGEPDDAGDHDGVLRQNLTAAGAAGLNRQRCKLYARAHAQTRLGVLVRPRSVVSRELQGQKQRRSRRMCASLLASEPERGRRRVVFLVGGFHRARGASRGAREARRVGSMAPSFARRMPRCAGASPQPLCEPGEPRGSASAPRARE